MDLSIFKELKKNGNGSSHGIGEEMLIGFSLCPYMATKDVLVIEKEVREDRLDEKNVFRCDIVALNVSYMKVYNPARPWVHKVRNN